ncbi:MAG: ABC transporter ATP-binding protein [Bdellovibrionales bacterium]
MILKAENLSKTYLQGSREIPVIEKLDFEIPKNESYAFVGKSGSGKTTLLSILSGILKPDGGDVTINGSSLYKLDEDAQSRFRAQNIGIVFQQYHLMPDLDIWENVCLPLEINQKDNFKKAESLIELVGLKDRMQHYPYQLSGGEQQRVAIARALAIEPKILFADEPSGNLDEGTGDKVMGLLFDAVSELKIPIVLVTHSKALADKCDHKFKVQNGSLETI